MYLSWDSTHLTVRVLSTGVVSDSTTVVSFREEAAAATIPATNHTAAATRRIIPIVESSIPETFTFRAKSITAPTIAKATGPPMFK